jgi:hypothetical protein
MFFFYWNKKANKNITEYCKITLPGCWINIGWYKGEKKRKKKCYYYFSKPEQIQQTFVALWIEWKKFCFFPLSGRAICTVLEELLIKGGTVCIIENKNFACLHFLEKKNCILRIK